MLGNLRISVVLLSSISVSAPSVDSYLITPDKATLVIGESRPFRMVDQNGRAQHQVTWAISDSDAFQSSEGDELYLTATRAGEFRITARTDYATAEATVKVMDGPLLPAGTVKWSSRKMDGCRTTKISPAVPRPNGPDIFEQSQCEDGVYVAAYTSDGVQLWRRKLSDSGKSAISGNAEFPVVGHPLNVHATSVCDSVYVGTDQQKIRDLLTQRKLSFRKGSSGDREWTVEESGTQCRLWFNDQSVLAKKRKTLLDEWG